MAKQKLVIRSHYNPLVSPTKYESNDEESMTVQGEGYTIKELLSRAIEGLPLGRREVQYLDQEDLSKISQFYRPIVDMSDLDYLKEHNAALQFQIDKFEQHKKELDEIDPAQLDMFNSPDEVPERPPADVPPKEDKTKSE